MISRYFQNLRGIGEPVNLIQNDCPALLALEQFWLVERATDAHELAIQVTRIRQRLHERRLADPPNTGEPHDAASSERVPDPLLPERTIHAKMLTFSTTKRNSIF